MRSRARAPPVAAVSRSSVVTTAVAYKGTDLVRHAGAKVRGCSNASAGCSKLCRRVRWATGEVWGVPGIKSEQVFTSESGAG